jgi:Fe-S-cluster containining protein
MNLPLRRTELTRQVPFSFSCSRCITCCRHKRIQVNPYEIARLAANCRLTTADFIERYTHNNATILNWDEESSCVFLTAAGCSVHADRPLVCRLYPLGRHVLASGEEHFSEIEPDQGCTGVYGNDGMIADYLDAQGTRPFMAAADSYLALFWRLFQIMTAETVEPEEKNAVTMLFQECAAGHGLCDNGLADVDAIVATYCEKLDIPMPHTVDDKMLLHIQAVDAWAHAKRGARHEETREKRNARKDIGKTPAAGV